MPPTAVATARPATESSGRSDIWRNKSQRARRNRLAKAANKRQAKAKKAHAAKLAWLKKWQAKNLKRINESGKSAAWKRKSRNAINSKYNRWRAAEIKKFKRITANNYSPAKLSVRTETDIFEHYDIHRLFSSDLSVGGLNDIIAGDVAGSTPYVPEEYANALDQQYTPPQPTLNLGVATLADLIEWVEVFDDSNNRTYTAIITIPNSDAFSEVRTRISG